MRGTYYREGKLMGLPRSQRRILETIENELRVADPALICSFSAFTSVTRSAAMPGAEQLGAQSRLAAGGTARRIGRLGFADRQIVTFAAAVVLLLGAVLGLCTPQHDRCAAPAKAAVWGRLMGTCVPTGPPAHHLSSPVRVRG